MGDAFKHILPQRVYDQYSGPRSAEFRAHCIILENTLLGDSTIPFCDDASALVNSSTKPSLLTIVTNFCERSSSLS